MFFIIFSVFFQFFAVFLTILREKSQAADFYMDLRGKLT